MGSIMHFASTVAIRALQMPHARPPLLIKVHEGPEYRQAAGYAARECRVSFRSEKSPRVDFKKNGRELCGRAHSCTFIDVSGDGQPLFGLVIELFSPVACIHAGAVGFPERRVALLYAAERPYRWMLYPRAALDWSAR